ncbi:MAG: integron integrase [Candidatus Omnitrophica bacterium]|nr:integron integrase [Candidatus Omnitrophota bacterium]
MTNAIRVKHFSYSTERTYVTWAKRFFDYLNKGKRKQIYPQKLTPEDVKDYLTYLAIEGRVSSSTQNQAFNALLFLFRDVLKIEVNNLAETVRAKRGPKLPTVLSVKEIQGLFEQLRNKDLLIVQLLYGSGLRLMELVRLRVQDIDFESNILFLRGAKGDKDRSTMLPQALGSSLRKHLEQVKNIFEEDKAAGYGEVYLPNALEHKYSKAAKEWGWQYAFPSSRLSIDPRSGKIRRHHISPNTVQKIVAIAVKKAGIIKRASVHTLRHSFATHLLMNGVNIREVQELLGHKHVETTMIYTHILRDMVNIPESPLDNLYDKRGFSDKNNGVASYESVKVNKR